MIRHVVTGLALVSLTVACVSPLEYVDSEVRETRQEFQEDLQEARELLLSGEITVEEYDELVEQSKKLAEARLKEIPEDVRELVESQSDGLKERGRSFVLSLMDILLMGVLSGGVGAVGLAGYQARKKNSATSG